MVGMLKINDLKSDVKPIVRRWINSKEACEYLGCKDTFLKELRNNNLIIYSNLSHGKSHTKGRAVILYSVESLDRYIERCKVNDEKTVNAILKTSFY